MIDGAKCLSFFNDVAFVGKSALLAQIYQKYMQHINGIPTGNTRMSANLKKEIHYFRAPESCLHVQSEDKEMAVGKGIVEKLCIVI